MSVTRQRFSQDENNKFITMHGIKLLRHVHVGDLILHMQ